MSTRGVAVGTVVARNYLPFARVLAASLERFHPELPTFVVVVDAEKREHAGDAAHVRVLSLDDLDIADLGTLTFRYTRQQVVVAAKAHLIEHLLREFDAVLFIDADMLVLADLSDLIETTRTHAITLVPHLLEPPSGAIGVANERRVRLAGTFNGGVLGVARGEPAARFLAWWQERLATHCLHAVEQGMHFDQRWLDLAPIYFDDVHIVRDPGVNVAYWNVAERPVHVRGDAVLAGGVPCRLFHFSGFDPNEPALPSIYAADVGRDDVGEARALFARYRRELVDAGWPAASAVEYGFSRFDNGVVIPDIVRAVYSDLEDRDRFGDPFATRHRGSFFRWLNQKTRWPRRFPTRLWEAVHARRPDLQIAYPDPTSGDRAAFAQWAATYGTRELGIPDALA